MQVRNSAIRIAGPLAGGVLFAAAAWLPFGVDAASFLAGAGGVAAIRRPLGPDAPEAGRERLIPSIVAGLRYIRRDGYLTYLTIWSCVMNCVLTGGLLLVIVLVKEHGGSAALVGAVNAIGAVGGLIGSLLATKITKRVPGRTIALAISWIIVAVMVGIAFVPQAWQIGVLLAGMTFLLGPINVVFATYETRMIPDELSGRVSNAIDFGSSILRWAGPLGAGLLAAAFSPTVAMVSLAVPVAVLAVSAHRVRGLHVLNRPIDEIVPAPRLEVADQSADQPR
jgi:predicted MFS family arabinose efflux permease